MDRNQTIAARAAAEQPSQRVRKKFDPKKLITVAIAGAVFLGFVWFVMGHENKSTNTGVRVDALQQGGGERYGLLTARGPEADEPEPEALPEELEVATPATVPQVDSEGLKQALKTIEQQNGRISDLQDELTDAKVSLSEKDGEIATLNLTNERLQVRYDEREKKFQTELAQAIADAEARALASVSHLQAQGLTDDERRRLEELKKMRQRQNQSDGIVFDENPYGRN
jgi:regulator of replication initiation timing